MRNLIDFFIKRAFFFTFLLLEIFCFILIVNWFEYQRSIIADSSNAFIGSIYRDVDNVTNYFHLAQENKKLADENAKLKSLNLRSYRKVFGSNVIVNDTLYKQQYVYSDAQVINNEVFSQNNFITLNAGYLQGIKKGMGVISTNGVVGIVKDVSKHFSTVISLLNSEMKVSVKLKKNHYFASLAWAGINYHYCLMTKLPSNVKISKGDTIVTSGYSSIFPENIPIGTIESYHVPEGQSFYKVKVKLFLDFKDLNTVYIVKNLFKNEIGELNKKENNPN